MVATTKKHDACRSQEGRCTPSSERAVEEAEELISELRVRRACLEGQAAMPCERWSPSCSGPRPCARMHSMEDVIEAAAQAEARLGAAYEEVADHRARCMHIATAARKLAACDDELELLELVPQLARAVAGAHGAALLSIDGEGAVEVLSRAGDFEAPSSAIAAGARAVLAEAASGSADAFVSRSTGLLLVVPLGTDCASPVLAVERDAGGPSFSQAQTDHVAVYASLAATALLRIRATAKVREAAARDAALLAAIRDGVIAVDREGVVTALNHAAAAALRVRREDLLGKRLRDYPGMIPLARSLASPAGDDMDLVSLARGDVVVRAQRHDGGVVATIRDIVTEHTIAHRVVGSVARYTFDQLIGSAPAFVRVVGDAQQAATSEVPVLVSGESGTGKEMLAQAIHNASPRAAGPFLGINVAAIPSELLESELFGYEGGAFTGAKANGRAGKFELAGRGTLLLDEIGDMPLPMQAKLLRVLQERVVQRLGGARDIPVRARIIATTHRDLAEAVQAGKFRLDLYHRLRVVQLRIPSLRERKQDIPLLVDQQLRAHAERTHRRVKIAPHVLDALVAYDWPGNVRELLNVLEGELSVLPSGESVLSRVPGFLFEPRPVAPGPAAKDGAAREVLTLDELERRACEEALAAHQGNVARAAKALGVAKGTLYAKIKRYGLGVAEVCLEVAPRQATGLA